MTTLTETTTIRSGSIQDRFYALMASVWAALLQDMTPQEMIWVTRPNTHPTVISSRRAAMLVSRVRMVSGLFAILTPLWAILDIAVFPPQIWHGLVLSRFLAAMAFAAIFMTSRKAQTVNHAYMAIASMFAVPTFFFIYSYVHMGAYHLEGLQQAFSVGYAYLPFVMLAGLAIFPLTVYESIAFSLPLLMAQVSAGLFDLSVLTWPTFAASFWLLMLISGVSTVAGVSQLAFILVMARDALWDALTGAFSRNSGEGLLNLLYSQASRTKSPLTLVFIDLDHFKSVNDLFGHDAGDKVLQVVSKMLRSRMRTDDALIRWGGEEFLMVLPNTSVDQAVLAMRRILGPGLGVRPDGAPITASVGVAEKKLDESTSWRDLVEIGDRRMYVAKNSGRDKWVGPNNEGISKVAGA